MHHALHRIRRGLCPPTSIAEGPSEPRGFYHLGPFNVLHHLHEHRVSFWDKGTFMSLARK